jgi:DNA-binding NtrC family response regulator
MSESYTPTCIIHKDDAPDALLVRKCRIIVVAGPHKGQEFVTTKDRFTIGASHKNDLIVDDPSVSRTHSEIQLIPEGYLIRDLNSTNGTVVQGVKISEAFLNEGADIQLGAVKLLFCPLNDVTEHSLSSQDHFGKVLGKSIPMRKIFHIAETYSPTETGILIEGPTGTGKEVLAEEIHNHSKRKGKPFVVIDCSALAGGIVESELFGHAKGAFTGANAARMGAFELANGGTIFIDEIGKLGMDMQPKLLRVLEKREVRPMGSNTVKKVDVRIICASNLSLQKEVNADRFREDLYYRIAIVKMELSPLKHRREDIPMLVRLFISQLADKDEGSKEINLDKTMQAFNAYDWPGNIRELRNLVEMAYHSPEGELDLGSRLYMGKMGMQPAGNPSLPASQLPFKVAKNRLIRDFEDKYIREILEESDWNVSRAARRAEIERAYLTRLMKKHGLKR